MSDDDRPEPFHAYPESPDLGRVDDLLNELEKYNAGDVVRVALLRGEEELEVEVELSAANE